MKPRISVFGLSAHVGPDWSFGSALSLTLLALVGAIFALGAACAGTGRIVGAEGRA